MKSKSLRDDTARPNEQPTGEVQGVLGELMEKKSAAPVPREPVVRTERHTGEISRDPLDDLH